MTAAVAGALTLVMTDVGWRRTATVVAGTALAVASPPLAMSLAAAWFLVELVRRRRAGRDRGRRAAADLAALCDLVLIGLTGGLGLRPALEMAARHVGGELGEEAVQVLRRSRVHGLAESLAVADGYGRPLYRVVARATMTGASLEDQVRRLADDVHAERSAAELEAVRKLPVAMLLPLTLLILPGFLLLTIAPAILDAFGRLEL